MRVQSLPNFDSLAKQFDGLGVNALVLMGSYARGNPGVFSDIDLVRFIGKGGFKPSFKDGSYLIDGFLVTVSSVNARRIGQWFSCPEIAVNVIRGIRSARPLLDRSTTFDAIQRRAQVFIWDTRMQKKADHWVSKQMVGWIEEVHKGLEGLRSNDIGRMLNARFGFSWGLSRIMGVQKGVLLSGDNSFYAEIAEAVGADSKWVCLRQTAFAIEDQSGKSPSLREQIIAGLRLYATTVELLGDVIEPADAEIVIQTVKLIEAELGNR